MFLYDRQLLPLSQPEYIEICFNTNTGYYGLRILLFCWKNNDLHCMNSFVPLIPNVGRFSKYFTFA